MPNTLKLQFCKTTQAFELVRSSGTTQHFCIIWAKWGCGVKCVWLRCGWWGEVGVWGKVRVVEMWGVGWSGGVGWSACGWDVGIIC